MKIPSRYMCNDRLCEICKPDPNIFWSDYYSANCELHYVDDEYWAYKRPVYHEDKV